MRNAIATPIPIFLLAAVANASPVDLRPGTPERAALLDLVRPTVEEEVGAPVTFVVEGLEQEAGWVLARLVPWHKNGKPIDFNAINEKRAPAAWLQGVVWLLAERVGSTWEVRAQTSTDYEIPEGWKAKFAHTPLRHLGERVGDRLAAKDLPAWLRDGQHKPARCVGLTQPTEAFDTPSAKAGTAIAADTGLRLGEFSGARAEVWYAAGRNAAQCSDSASLPQHGWVSLTALPAPTVLAQDFVPLDGRGKPAFQTQLLPLARVAFSAGKTLLTADLGGFAEEDAKQLHVWLVFTGQSLHPLAFFYSGFSNDMYGDPGVLILFGAGTRVEWKPDYGNRVTSGLVRTGQGTLVIKEAFHCGISMETTLAFREAGIERLSAEMDFTVPEGGAVRAKIVSFTATDRKDTIRLGRGDRITKLVGYDFPTKLVRVKVRRAGSEQEIERWVEKAALEKLAVPLHDFACCGCG
ncbi:MAG: hypothetical protein ACLQIJ_11475 [Polyangia bacterium]